MKLSLAEDNEEMIKVGNLCKEIFIEIINAVGDKKGSEIINNIERHIDENRYDIDEFIYKATWCSKDENEETYTAAYQFIENTVYSLGMQGANYGANQSYYQLEETKSSLKITEENVGDILKDISELFSF